MTGPLRLVVLSLAGFLTPVLLTIAIFPLIFRSDQHQQTRGSLRETNLEIQAELAEESLDSAGGYYTIASAPELDPAAESAFLLLTNVKFNQLPEEGQRSRVLAKFASDLAPYSGWAFSLKRINGQLRPQVYWREPNGRGGWYTFADAQISVGQWYQFSVLFEKNAGLRVYLSSTSQTENNGRIAFLGGYPMSERLIPSCDSPLYFGSERNADGTFPAEVKELILARPKKLPDKTTEVEEFLKQDLQKLRQQFDPRAVSLAIVGASGDSSIYRRSIISSQTAS